MNYTKNYRLPQWVKEDRIMMDDFNAMNSSIENGLTRTAAQAAEASNKADTAVQTANSARQDVQTWKNYAVGSYTGKGLGQSMMVQLGFRPSFVIICGYAEDTTPQMYNYGIMYSAIGSGNEIPHVLSITDNGFVILANTPPVHYPNLLDTDRVYNYIAFR